MIWKKALDGFRSLTGLYACLASKSGPQMGSSAKSPTIKTWT